MKPDGKTRDVTRREALDASSLPVSHPLLRALSGVPVVAAYFAPDGELRWLSDQGRAWIGSGRDSTSGDPAVTPTKGRLKRLAAFTRAAAAQVSPVLEPAGSEERRRLGLRPGQRLLARRVPAREDDPGGVLVCLLEDALTPGEAALSVDRLTRLGLTLRESDVAALSARGFSLKSTAARLGLSESTVHTHLKRVYQKLGVSSRAELCYRLLSGP